MKTRIFQPRPNYNPPHPMGGPGPNQQGAPPLQAQYGQANMQGQRPPNQQQPNMRPPPNMQQQGNNMQQQGQQGPYGQQQYPPRPQQQQSGQQNPADHPGWSQ